MNIYMAPMEGITTHVYRRIFNKYYSGIDRFYTPFVSPNGTMNFTTKEWNEIKPENNLEMDTVPQLLTNNAEHFCWAFDKISSLGYKEINLNLGCPSGTVTAKKKGSGLLAYPEELDSFLYSIFQHISSTDIKLSIKTRIGRYSPDEWEEILDIYNKYDICELIVHPRIQKDMYNGKVRLETFNHAYRNSRNNLCYNGDIYKTEDFKRISSSYPDINAVMLGRGLISNPQLAEDINSAKGFDKLRFKNFHDELLSEYASLFSGDVPALGRMKELWFYSEKLFPGHEKEFKKIKKARKISEYKTEVNKLFN